MLSEKDVAAWKNQELTKKVLELVREEMDLHIAHIASGRIIGDTMEETAQRVCQTAGVLEGLGFIFEIEGEVDESE